ncbi:uncharacterized protein LOC112890427 [Panicum hallii]|jgi:hypothetical protein|uniref:uncharacterized protein LOC112890427 n=1 Tax=Panicum hallii TaxID=206008 RepID=UPI000DF4D167|nr:uncharacterized protein LOC112890427 [Panicum hallii]
MGCEKPFGGKVILFGGDVRQVLPMVPRGTRAQIIDATLLRSYIWKSVRRIRLTQNMRAQTDTWFADYLLTIGNKMKEAFDGDYVRLPNDILIQNLPEDDSIDILIDLVFSDHVANCTSATYMHKRAIISTRNEHVDAVNALMIDRFPGKQKVFYSFDSVDDDSRNNYPLDFLNSITPNGLPPHELKVNKNCHVILLRNLDSHNGLYNGHRKSTWVFAKRNMNIDPTGKSTKNIVYRDVLES